MKKRYIVEDVSVWDQEDNCPVAYCPSKYEAENIAQALNYQCAHIVSHRFFGEDIRFDCEATLSFAKKVGTIIEYDDGRDRDPWFNAMPSEEVNALREIFIKAGYVERND